MTLGSIRHAGEAPWLTAARRHMGLAEIPGKDTAPVIAGWLLKLKAWWADDETPWCGVFVAACLNEACISLPKHWYRAKGYLDWGWELKEPRLGCVVVYDRKGGGHVGFVVGKDSGGRLMTLGGNQGNRVSIAPFDSARVLGYRWPRDAIDALPIDPLPILASSAASSSQEA